MLDEYLKEGGGVNKGGGPSYFKNYLQEVK